jgi:hypothetical protein
MTSKPEDMTADYYPAESGEVSREVLADSMNYEHLAALLRIAGKEGQAVKAEQCAALLRELAEGL